MTTKWKQCPYCKLRECLGSLGRCWICFCAEIGEAKAKAKYCPECGEPKPFHTINCQTLGEPGKVFREIKPKNQ